VSSTTLSGPSPAAPKEEGSRLARNLTALLGGQAVTWTMTLLWTLIVPRALGPAGLGLVVTAMSVCGVVSLVLGLGTRTYIMREIVVDQADAPRLVGTGIMLRLLTAPLFAIALVVYAHFADYDHEARLVLYLVGAATILTLLAEPMQAGFQGIERMQYLAYSDVLNKSSLGLIGIAVVLVGFRAVGIAANMALVAAVVLVLNLYWLRRFFRIHLRTRLGELASMMKHSFAYMAYGVFGMFYLWIDTVMLSLMTRSEVVGWYGAPTRLFQTLMFIPVLVSTAWLPRMIAAHEESPERLLKTARTPVELVIVLSAPICAGTAMVAGTLVPLLYGPAYTNAVPVMVVLGLCLPAMYANIILAALLVAQKRQIVWTWVMVGSAIFNPLVNLVLIPWTQHQYGNGAIGAALSLLLTELLMVAMGMWLVGRHLYTRSLIKRCSLVIASSAAMWVVAYLARPLGFLVSTAAGCLTFVALVAVLRIIRPDEISFIRERLRRPRPGTVG
jgi:O-antigen/teichoic acid export membrane protein